MVPVSLIEGLMGEDPYLVNGTEGTREWLVGREGVTKTPLWTVLKKRLS